MKVVYLIGPYRSDTEYGVHLNIQDAERQALQIWKLGAACICPHKNTAYFGGACLDEVWLEGDLEIMRRCDAVYCGVGDNRSVGGQAELAEARRFGLPIAYSFQELNAWLKANP